MDDFFAPPLPTMSGFGASPDGLGATLRVLGDAEPQQVQQVSSVGRNLKIAFAVASVASAGACAFHGYRRNESVGWAIGWALLGATFPIVTVAVAMAQGFGEEAK
jgi:hypothetical protein